MTPEDDTRDLVRRAGDAVPATPAPVETLLQQGRGARRRRTVTTIGVVAAAVAVIASGAVAVGAQLGPDSEHPLASRPTIPGNPNTTAPAAGTRLVGWESVGVAVPASWSTNRSSCFTAMENTVIVGDPAGFDCMMVAAPDSSVLLEPYEFADSYKPSGTPLRKLPSTSVQLGEDRAERVTTFSYRLGVEPFFEMYEGALLVPSRDVVIDVRSPNPAVIDQVLESAFLLSPSSVSIPERSAPHSLRALGLEVEVRLVYRRGLSSGTVLGSSPPWGSVVARGSDVAVTVSTRQPRCWAAPVEVVAPMSVFRPSQGFYVGGPMIVHVGDHLTLKTIGPCGDAAYFIRPPGSVLTRLNGREAIATHRGTVRLAVARLGAPGIGNVEVQVRR